MKNRQSRMTGIVREFDLPEDVCSGGYHVEMFNETVIVDGCRNVAEYSGGLIKLNTGNTQIAVSGDNLTIRNFACSQVTVTGRIISVELI